MRGILVTLLITDTRTYTQTDRRTDGRYQMYYLPGFAVDNQESWTVTIKGAQGTHVLKDNTQLKGLK